MAPELAIACAAVVILAAYYGGRALASRDRFTVQATSPVVSSLDGRAYRVHGSLTGAGNGPDRAADTLAALNGRIIALLRHLRARYVRGKSGGADRRAAVARLLARYNPDNLTENSPKDPSGDTSYSLNKGALVALCIRERDPAESGDPLVHDIHEMSTLTFVSIHEMAHLAIDEFDHPRKFWSAFRFLLEEAADAGIYVSPDFAASPRSYCGMRIDYNPAYDAGTPSL